MPGCLGRTRPPQAPPRACYCIVLIDHILYILYYRIDQSAGDEAESQLLKASKQDGSLLWSALRVSAMAKMWIFEHDIFAQYKRNTYDFFRRNKLDTNTCTFFLLKRFWRRNYWYKFPMKKVRFVSSLKAVHYGGPLGTSSFHRK